MFVILGAVIRVPWIQRSLWLDESAVANAMLQPRWADVLSYPYFIPNSPPLFLALGKLAVAVLGPGHVALRLVPYLGMVAALVLLLVIAAKWFRGVLAALPVALLVLAPMTIYYAHELKPYTTDMLAQLAVLCAAWRLLEQPDERRAWWLIAVTALAQLLSFPAVTAVPVALLALWWARVDRRLLAVQAAVSGVIALGEQFVSLQSSKSPTFLATWYDQFAHSPLGLWNLWQATVSGFVLLLGLPWNNVAVPVGWLLFACAGVALRRRDRRVALAGLPVAGLFGLNLLHLYPLSVSRVMLFALPSGILLMTIGLEQLVRWVEPRLPLLARQVVTVSAWAALVGGVAVLARNPLLLQPIQHEETAEAFGYLRQHSKPGDTVYVHASMREPARFYLQRDGALAARTVFGDTGWPCCPRQEEFDRTNRDADYLLQDLRAKLDALPRRVWLLYTARPEHWTFVGRAEDQLHLLELQQQGCRLESEHEWTGVVAYQVGCGAR